MCLGSLHFSECGVISGGRCHGDTLWGWGVYKAFNTEGCAMKGNPGQVGLIRRVEVFGKCASKCNLGLSVHKYIPPVSNRGLPFSYEESIEDRKAVEQNNTIEDNIELEKTPLFIKN